MKSSVVWLSWPLRINSFLLGVSGFVLGIKISRSHARAIISSVQAFSVAIKNHSLNLFSSFENHYYYTVLPLKIINGGRATPRALTHLITVVQVLKPACCRRAKRFLKDPRTSPLSPWPSIMPLSSILYRCLEGMTLIAGLL
jgi:hypothetical protein